MTFYAASTSGTVEHVAIGDTAERQAGWDLKGDLLQIISRALDKRCDLDTAGRLLWAVRVRASIVAEAMP